MMEKLHFLWFKLPQIGWISKHCRPAHKNATLHRPLLHSGIMLHSASPLDSALLLRNARWGLFI